MKPQQTAEFREAARRRATTHGGAYSREYRIWINMLGRCRNPNYGNYYKYGGKGIKVCRRWTTFANFLQDMGPCPTAKHTLDRRDSRLGYSPSNCRWATGQMQSRNRSSMPRATYRGETKTIIEFAEEHGLPSYLVRSRLSRGWSIEAALTTPTGG